MADSWTQEVFDIDAIKEEAPLDLVMCCCCPAISSSVARTKMDGSACIFNWCCMSLPASRNVIRTGYEIEGSWINDCLLGCCCPWFVSLQMLSEVKARNGEDGPTDFVGVIKEGFEELKAESSESAKKVKKDQKDKKENKDKDKDTKDMKVDEQSDKKDAKKKDEEESEEKKADADSIDIDVKSDDGPDGIR